MTLALDLSSAQKELLMQLVHQFLPDVGLWAFGSRIKGCARASSDLDLVFFAKPAQKAQLFALQEALEESALPFKVDLLVWDDIPENFKANIRQQYIELVKRSDGLTS